MSEQAIALSKGWQSIIGPIRSVPQSAWYRGMCLLLILWLVYAAAQFTWLLLPDDRQSKADSKPVAAAVVGGQPDAEQVDIGALQALNLFGNADKSVPVEDAPPAPAAGIEDNAAKTRLDLSLLGLVFSPNQEESVAVIESSRKQEQYSVGDKLPVGNNVTLAKILLDRVILDNNGRYESLWLYDDSNRKSSRKPAPVADKTDLRSNRGVTKLAKDYRQRVYESPKSLAEAIRISPAQQDGKMLGYRISPGRDKQQFEEFGFLPNDIIVGVNDIDLKEPSQALEVYKTMRTATEANFSVLRDGETVEIMVNLGE